MYEVPWQKYSSTEDHFRHNEYLFKRKKRGTGYTYEIWINDKLERNNLDYWRSVQYAQNVQLGRLWYS